MYEFLVNKNIHTKFINKIINRKEGIKLKALLLAEKSSQKNLIVSTYNKHKEQIPYELDFIAFSGHIDYMKLPKEYEEWNAPMNLEYLPIFPDESKTGWQFGISNMEIFKKVKEALKKDYDFIIHAGDPDAEGEVLINRILTMLHNTKPVKRFWTQDLTDKTILDKLLNLEDDNSPIFQNLNTAGQLRAEYDYIIGMNGTTAACVSLHTRAIVGRVMSPALNIMTIRENEIRNYKPIPTYEVIEDYGGFVGTYFDSEGNVKFNTKKEAENFISMLSSKAKVKSIEKKEEKRYAPELFILSKLQKEAGKLGIGIKQSTDIVQKLYEEGLISYPRTDCSVMSSAMINELPILLKTVASIPKVDAIVNCVTPSDIYRVSQTKTYVNDKAVSEGNHTAIIPTTKKPDISSLSEDELKILKLVYFRFLAIFLPPQIKDRTVIITEDDGYEFRSSGAVTRSKGWTVLYGGRTDDEKTEDAITLNVSEGDIIDGIPAINEKINPKPKRYTDAEFATVMESPAKFLVNQDNKDTIKASKGIGTQATRMEVISKLAKNGYIRLEQVKKGSSVSHIYVTDAGMSLIDVLTGQSIINVDLTAEMEDRLSLVKKGQLTRGEFIKMVKEQTLNMINEMKHMDSSKITGSQHQTIGKCPSCGGNVYYSENKNVGYCGNNECRFMINSEFLGAKINKNDMITLLSGNQISKTLRKNGNSWQQSLYIGDYNNPNTGIMEKRLCFVPKENDNDNRLECQCPMCGEDIKQTAKYFLCTQYKSTCDFILSKEFKGAKFTESNLKELLSGKSIKKKFKWDSGKTSENLCHLENGRLKIEFDK